MKNKYLNLIIATVAGTGVGIFILMMMIPTLLGLMVGNNLNIVLGIRRVTGWGLAMGLMHCMPATFIAARVAIGREAKELSDRILLTKGVAITIGVIAGIGTTTILWVLKPLRVSPQGPPVLHIANFAGIAMAAFCAAATVVLISQRLKAQPDRPEPTTIGRSLTLTVLLWSLLLWSPIAMLGCVVWGSQLYWDPASFHTRQLESEDSYQRFLAIYKLSEEQAYSPDVIHAVGQRLSDDDFQVQGKALEYITLAALQGPDELAQVKQLKNSEDQQIREGAIEAIELTKYDFTADREAAEKALAMRANIDVYRFGSMSRIDWNKELDSSLFQLTGVYLENLSVVSGNDLAGFSNSPMLSELKLIGTEITEDGLEQLTHFPALKRLWITGSKLNDDDLQILAKIPELAYLDVSKTQVTSKGINAFLNMKSNCEVHWTIPVAAP
ncbi:hypothetical protein [Aporhodopirellula aestuarii]|uniref:Leucine Rich repeats (2 copies) n=1 Tax=Aporhodopirellula aestuarii TaxID=2950107 RepID=A0ABT0U664_9BACT|nr:hypothetical protein [Aporhodopirellula aestuarii]MCM2371888.1 hypothetical protein [Aporhodopirellula aestuarii]